MMKMVSIPSAEIYYDRNFLPAEQATLLFDVLLARCAWQRHKTSFQHPVPRDEAYYGDPVATYTYSRRKYKPLAWIPELLTLKALLQKATPAAACANCGQPIVVYNAVLCNLYKNGNDSMGLQADAEAEMGPIIASMSLGAERLFRKNGTVKFAERLPHGSLFIMAGETQRNFKHELPKEPSIVRPQINLTFRRIQHQ